MRLQKAIWLVAAAAAILGPCTGAMAQLYSLQGNLPSERLGSGFFAGVTRAGQFTGRGGAAAPLGPLAVRFSVRPDRLGGGYHPPRFDFSHFRPDLSGLRLRTLESVALANRARFSDLQRMSLELTDLVGGEKLLGPKDVRQSFFQFVFPFGLRDKPGEGGYGYFCLGCLPRGLIADPEAFLSEFSEETQETLADEPFMKAVASMLTEGRLPEGRQLDQLYDSQLAAMGNFLFSNRRYAAAAEAWTLLARRDPQSSLFAQAAGQTLFARRQFEEAAAQLRRSLTLAPRWGTPQFRLAGANLQNIYAEAEDLAEARMNLEGLMTTQPDNRDLQFLMAYIDLFHGLWDRAERRFATLGAGGDGVARHLLDTLRTGRVAEEIRRPFARDDVLMADDVIQMTTDVLLSAEERKAMADAILNPQSYRDHMSRGDYYFFMGNYARASEAYATATRLQPGDAIAKFAEAHAAFANAEYRYAARRLKEGLAMESKWGLFNFRLEEFFGDRNDMDKRLRDLEHLTQLRPEDLDARLLLAYVYYFDGRYADAARTLSQVVQAATDYPMADHLLKLARLQS